MRDHCPTCGARVRVVSSDEGTAYYEPADEHARLEEMFQAKCNELLDAVHELVETRTELAALREELNRRPS
jgi:uncharacterized Zn finger protein (UPF0148 family)